MLRVLDHQFHQVEGLFVDECEHSDTNAATCNDGMCGRKSRDQSLNKLYGRALGISIGHYLFIYLQPTDVQDPIVCSLVE
ncbi:hypothetical protein PVL29_001392 [Vitis rotundifolia]|uniref:Uncharacterized protein n=1 Tax=Vitis rotundifolia TaxID=103349 RepID=A0AA39E561_VITRO|nr:hypothetical protein PVL29_001392 [Vitis rotundifolia]